MDLFNTVALVAIVNNLPPVPSALLDRYFKIIQTSDAEIISFDTITGKRRLAPLVSPTVAGRINAALGYKTSTFKPAYVKDKRLLQPGRALKRRPGEIVGGNLTPAQRLQTMVGVELLDKGGAVNTLDLGVGDKVEEGLIFMGRFDNFNIFLYVGWYVDEGDVTHEIWPSNHVAVGSAGMDGVQAFGAILDIQAIEAGVDPAAPRPGQYYVKSWVQEDPSARVLLMQSAPLMVPTVPDAFMSAEVL